MMRRVVGIVSVGLACALLCSGCGIFGSKESVDVAGGDDVLVPEALDGDYALTGGRPDDMSMVTDVSFECVYFDYDSFTIAPSELGKIERIASYLTGNPSITLVVDGHCDERGSREYNLSLGEHRALAVRAHVIRLGVEGSRIQTRSFGEEQPADPGHNASAWRLNRRAEFALYR